MIEHILTKLGYREMRENVWWKPVGYQLFAIKCGKDLVEWINYFKGADDKIYVWERKLIKNDESLEFNIKLYESYTKINIQTDSDFGFLTREELYSELLCEKVY